MLPQKIAFVDIETTGLSATRNRIIEIGIVQVEDNKLVNTFHSLINPETYLPREIETITGITAKDLENAPTFRSIKHDILEALIDYTFVAHNVRFDYGFVKNEFKRENISFSSRHFCTVKLSRFLFPNQRRHNLDALIKRFNIACETRHRALDDAKVLFTFYQKLQETLPQNIVHDAIMHCLKKTTTPLRLAESFLETLPEQSGVYIFYDGKNMPLYVGKSKNIKERVLNHFASDISSATEMNISQQIERLETIITAGELGALFLESKLIKKMLPLYNKKSRIKRELITVKFRVNKDGYNECFLEPITVVKPEELETFLGFFRSRKSAKEHLTEIAKKFYLCEKLLGLESASWRTKGACFAYRLGRCTGACIGREQTLKYNLKFLTAFKSTKIEPWPFAQAIIIEEHEIDGRREYFAVDKWCLVGHITVDAEGNKKSTLEDASIFDLDLYQIIKSYLKKPSSNQNIKQVPRKNLSLFFE